MVADNGPKLQPALSEESDELKEQGAMHMGRQQMRMQIGGNQVYGIGAQSTPLDDFAQQLSRQLGTPVINKTGLQGRYDFNLHWSNGKRVLAKRNQLGVRVSLRSSMPCRSSLA